MTHFTLSHTTSADGIRLYTLRNHTGMRVTISDLGATMVNWWAPDRYGREADVLLGFERVEQYTNNPAYFGAIVGRWGNRIAGGHHRRHRRAGAAVAAGLPVRRHRGAGAGGADRHRQ